MNKDKLISNVHKWSKERKLAYNIVLWNFFTENLMAELCRKEYSNNFVIKGGVLMSNMVGLDKISTVDVDFQIRNFDINKIEEKLQEILANPMNTDIKYTVLKKEKIKKGDEYGGYRVMVLCQFENMKNYISIDFATGGVVTPSIVEYDFITMDGKIIKVLSYPIETIIAEKLHAIVKNDVENSRTKDYYDLFLVRKYLAKSVRFDILYEAITKTFESRGINFSIETTEILVAELRTNPVQLTMWKYYSKNTEIDCTFDDTMDSVLWILEKIKD